MFEKEAEEKAEEYANKNVPIDTFGFRSLDDVHYDVKQAFLAGLEYNNKQIAELKEKISVLLSCKNCPENKGGWICVKEYENKCLAQKIEFIKELEKENAELKANNQFLNNLIREKEQRGLEIQEDLLRENEKLKEQCLILADCNTCHSTCKNENIEMKKQLTKAKELIKRLYDIVCGKSGDDWELIEKAERFIKE